jgi:hypothetical protein
MRPPTPQPPADLIVTGGQITTCNDAQRSASALAARDGRFLAVGSEPEVLAHRGPRTQVVDARGRRLIPGLIDSHLHVLRGGLQYNMELRWDGIPSLSEALGRLAEQAARTPPPQWVRVVGGWSEFQFAERRMPTLAEINAVTPETPVFVLHLYDRAWLNGAALRAVGYTKDTPDPPGGVIERDRAGNPTGLLIARPNALLLYATLARGPKLSFDEQMNSSRQFQRELNRLGITSAVDAGGGLQNYPDDYAVIDELVRRGESTVRIAYNLFTQRPGAELDDFRTWARQVKPGDGDAMLRFNGAGEMLVFSAADFEDFLEPRPELSPSLEGELEAVVTLLAENRWPFRLHATYDESISRFLDVFEKVNRAVPLTGLRWFFDHAETVGARNIERIAALGGGVAIQHRMAFQGEYFRERYGDQAARHAPPVRELLASGIPLGGGTDATRVASYNPWIGLYWLVTGKTVGGTRLYGATERLSRDEALRLYTERNAWFSGEVGEKGQIVPGQLADFALLSEDYFAVEEERIKEIQSDLTVLGGRVVWASGPFAGMAPPPLPFSPDWSPPRVHGAHTAASRAAPAAPGGHAHQLSCSCFAFSEALEEGHGPRRCAPSRQAGLRGRVRGCHPPLLRRRAGRVRHHRRGAPAAHPGRSLQGIRRPPVVRQRGGEGALLRVRPVPRVERSGGAARRGRADTPRAARDGGLLLRDRAGPGAAALEDGALDLDRRQRRGLRLQPRRPGPPGNGLAGVEHLLAGQRARRGEPDLGAHAAADPADSGVAASPVMHLSLLHGVPWHPAVVPERHLDDEAAATVRDRVDVLLAAQTHGGPMNPVFGVWHVPLARIEPPFVDGRHQLGAKTIIVTAGAATRSFAEAAGQDQAGGPRPPALRSAR